jgi:hypothetical protein
MPPNKMRHVAALCDDLAAHLELRGARSQTAGPSPDFARAVSRALAATSKSRRRYAHQLRSSSLRKRALAARHIGETYERAAGKLDERVLREQDRALGAMVISGLRGLRKGFRHLSSAAGRRNKRAYAEARREIRQAGDAVSTAIGSLRRAGYDVVTRPSQSAASGS